MFVMLTSLENDAPVAVCVENILWIDQTSRGDKSTARIWFGAAGLTRLIVKETVQDVLLKIADCEVLIKD